MIEKVKERMIETEVNKLSWKDLKYYTEIYISILKYEDEKKYRKELQDFINTYGCTTSISEKKEDEKNGL